MAIRREARPPGADGPATAGAPPFHLLAGEVARLSGVIRAVTETEVRWVPDWQAGEITMPRGCVQAIVQRPGEARVLADSFEAIDASRWTITGKPATGRASRGWTRMAEPPPARRGGLAGPQPGGAAGRRPARAGLPRRRDRGRRAAVHRRAHVPRPGRPVRDADHPGLVRGEPGRRVAERAGPAGPAAGPHARLAPPDAAVRARADRDRRRRQGAGPRPGTRGAAVRDPPGHPGDRARRRRPRRSPPTSTTCGSSGSPSRRPASRSTPTQDEARLVVGDQIFGELQRRRRRRVVMAVEGKPIPLRWSEVAGLYLRRVPSPGDPDRGAAGAGRVAVRAGRPAARTSISPKGRSWPTPTESLTLATPYAGTLTIPRAIVCGGWSCIGRGRRLVIDPAAHHLGDEISVTPPLLDPPQPEGLIARPDDRAGRGPRPARRAGARRRPGRPRGRRFRLFQPGPQRRAPHLRRGQRPADRLPESSHQDDANETPERIRIPIPRGLLRAGKNAMRIELTGDRRPAAAVRRPGDPPDRGGVPRPVRGRSSVARRSPDARPVDQAMDRCNQRSTDSGRRYRDPVKTLTRSMVRHAHAIAREVGARVILLHADVVEEDCDLAALIEDVDFRVILVSRRAGLHGADGVGRALRGGPGPRRRR